HCHYRLRWSLAAAVRHDDGTNTVPNRIFVCDPDARTNRLQQTPTPNACVVAVGAGVDGVPGSFSTEEPRAMQRDRQTLRPPPVRRRMRPEQRLRPAPPNSNSNPN